MTTHVVMDKIVTDLVFLLLGICFVGALTLVMFFIGLLRRRDPSATGWRVPVLLVGVLFVGGWLFLSRFQERPDGALFERLETPGAPTVEIYMHGFVDSSFDGYLVEGNRYSKIFDSLGFVPSNLRLDSGRKGLAETGRRAPASDPMYDIVWAKDYRRLGITHRGYLVAAYEFRSGLKLKLETLSKESVFYTNTDALIERFLRGDAVRQNDLEKAASAAVEQGKAEN